MSHFDPSWCARINAHRRGDSPAAAGETPGPRPRPPVGDGLLRPPAVAAPPPADADRGGPFRPRQIPKEHVCEVCGTVMYGHHCKIVCPNCGYKRDCSDP